MLTLKTRRATRRVRKRNQGLNLVEVRLNHPPNCHRRFRRYPQTWGRAALKIKENKGTRSSSTPSTCRSSSQAISRVAMACHRFRSHAMSHLLRLWGAALKKYRRLSCRWRKWSTRSQKALLRKSNQGRFCKTPCLARIHRSLCQMLRRRSLRECLVVKYHSSIN